MKSKEIPMVEKTLVAITWIALAAFCAWFWIFVYRFIFD